MTSAMTPTTDSGAPTRDMRTGVLIHPSTAAAGRFLILPHPRTFVPTYYLSSPTQLYELSTLSDTKYDRSWMISHLNQVVSSGQLDILSPIDARFLIISLLSVLEDGKFRSVEDTFEQVALVLQSRRREALKEAVPAVKDIDEEVVDWVDIVTFGNLPLTQKALQDVADSQDLPNGETAYRLSLPKIYSILDRKHSTIASQSTFAATPNTLGRNFERFWPHDSDPSTKEVLESKEAQHLREKIASEVVASCLPPRLVEGWLESLKAV